jgi:small-conductance mechanosensitive channel
VIPNTKITSGILVNHSLPDRRVAAEVMVLVGMDADTEQVMAIVMEVAGSTEGVLTEPGPVVMFDPGVTPTHLEFKLIVQVSDQMGKGGAQSSIRIRLLERFRDHGVPLPSVVNAVVVRS